MRDIALLLILLTLVWLAWLRPWWGALGLAFVSTMHPQGYAVGFMQIVPTYLVLFAAVVLGTARQFIASRALPELVLDWRLLALFALWGHFLLTTYLSINPWAAWPKFWQVAKVLPPMLLTLLLIDTREKLRYLNIILALSVAVVVIKGGYWALATGLNERVYGPPGSPYEGNNEFAVATCMMIPLLVFWYRELGNTGETRGLRGILAAMIGLCFVAALSSWSRGGLLSVVVVACLLVWHSRRKWLAVPMLMLGVGLVFVALPEAWFARMGSIGAAELDASAQSRIDLWRLGWEHALRNPWLGGGFQGWIYLSLPASAGLDWHSAYIKMAAEHGLLGLALWLSLVLGSMLNLTWLLHKNRRWRLPWLDNHAAMLRAALIAYAVGAVFLGIAYWELLFYLVVSAILLTHFANKSRPRVVGDEVGMSLEQVV